MAVIYDMAASVSEIVWGPFTMALLIAFGGYLTVKSRLRFILSAPGAVKRALSSGKGDISPCMALSNALAATMGTGNIVGVATAMASGGPGALLWMQIAALCGMMIKFSETALAVKYRSLGAGPMGYLKRIRYAGGALAAMFAVSCAAAALGSGCMTQSNSAAQALEKLSVSPLVCALLFGAVSWCAAGGGVKGMMRLSALIIPLITAGYLAMSAAVIIKLCSRLPEVLHMIAESAFSLEAAAGGAAGHTVRQAMRYGLSRGIFSNEAGMGSSAIGYSLANSADAAGQGMLSIAEVIADTVVCCSLTGLVLLLSGCPLDSPDGALTAINAFSLTLGHSFGAITAAFIAMFGLASVCGWYSYGAKSLEFLFPKNRFAPTLYRAAYAFCSAAGAILPAERIWLTSDLLTGVMMLINLLGLLLLSGEINDMISSPK